MDINELMKKKKGKEKLDPNYKGAKMGVLKEIMDMASGEMKGDLSGAHKVTVAASDEEGLKEGLDRAKESLNFAGQSEKEFRKDIKRQIGRAIDRDEKSAQRDSYLKDAQEGGYQQELGTKGAGVATEMYEDDLRHGPITPSKGDRGGAKVNYKDRPEQHSAHEESEGEPEEVAVTEHELSEEEMAALKKLLAKLK